MTDQQIMSEAVAREREIIRLKDRNTELSAINAVLSGALTDLLQLGEQGFRHNDIAMTRSINQARAAIAKAQS